MRDRPATYAETIRRGAETDPDAIALICGDDRLTWRQVFDRSCRAAQGMLETGVRRQERVAYIGKNSMEFFEVLYGASMIGAVPAGINWRLAASGNAGRHQRHAGFTAVHRQPVRTSS